MFKRALSLLFFTLLSLSALFFMLFQIREKDRLFYNKLVESSKPSQTASAYSKQARTGVIKQIWYGDKHIVIESRESELFFFHQDNQIEIVEELKDVKCIVQEELFYLLSDGREAIMQENGSVCLRDDAAVNPSLEDLKPMQFIRYFESAEGSYNYNTQLFCGKDVKLWKYKLEGHTLPASFNKETSLMSGSASSIEFTLKGKQMDVHAHQMRARFNPQEKNTL